MPLFNLPTRKEIILFRPNDYRYETLRVVDEDGIMLTAKKGRVTKRFWKHGPGWTHGRVTRFLAVEGNPVTAWLAEGERKEARVDEFLRSVWGSDAYENIPPEFRARLSEIGATVTVEPSKLPENVDMSPVKANEILQESDLRSFSAAWGQIAKISSQEGLIGRIIYILLGAFAMYFAVKQGII